MATRSAALVPTRDLERSLHQQGHQVIVGIDEVGKGSWAGPLAVGVAVLPLTGDLAGVRDSKSITEKTREAMFETVGNWCTSWAVGYASHFECDALGMADAQRLATKRALAQLTVVPDAAVVDGSWDFVTPLIPKVVMQVKGDTSVLSIAAASILG